MLKKWVQDHWVHAEKEKLKEKIYWRKKLLIEIDWKKAFCGPATAANAATAPAASRQILKWGPRVFFPLSLERKIFSYIFCSTIFPKSQWTGENEEAKNGEIIFCRSRPDLLILVSLSLSLLLMRTHTHTRTLSHTHPGAQALTPYMNNVRRLYPSTKGKKVNTFLCFLLLTELPNVSLLKLIRRFLFLQ